MHQSLVKRDIVSVPVHCLPFYIICITAQCFNLSIIPTRLSIPHLNIRETFTFTCRHLSGAVGRVLTKKGPAVQGIYRGFALRKIKVPAIPRLERELPASYKEQSLKTEECMIIPGPFILVP